MDVLLADIGEFQGGAAFSGNKASANITSQGSLILLVDQLQANVHVDLEIRNTAGTVVASRKEKGSAFLEGLVCEIRDNTGVAFSVVDDTGTNLIVEGDPSTFAKGTLTLRISGKIDGAFIRCTMDSSFGPTIRKGNIIDKGVYELEIEFGNMTA